MIFIIEDDPLMAKCVKKATALPEQDVKVFDNAIDAISVLNDIIPELIFLDILLIGPNGFTFLNEVKSYSETKNIPIVIISSLDLTFENLKNYGIVGVLNKATMLPLEIKSYVRNYTN